MYLACTVLAALLIAPGYISCQGAYDVDGAKLFQEFRNRLRQQRGLYAPRMAGAHFGYDIGEGPETWGFSFPDCNGRFQSPIDIKTNNLEYRQINNPLRWKNLEKTPAYMNVEKTEVSLGLTATWRNKWDIPYLTGGPLTNKFYFYHLHFHWNTSSDAGSEHTIDGRKYPMEVHVVYTTNPGGPPAEYDKTLVTGFMVNLSANDHPGYAAIIEGTRSLAKDVQNDAALKPFPLRALDIAFCEDYVIYSGSLTTPPCTGGVTWIISSRPMHLSARQYNTLKNTVSRPGRAVSANSRPTQSVNGRKIFYIVGPGCR